MRRLAFKLALHVLQFRLQLQDLGLLGEHGILFLPLQILFLALQALPDLGHAGIDGGALLGFEGRQLFLDADAHLLLLGQLRLELGKPCRQRDRRLPGLDARGRYLLFDGHRRLGAGQPQRCLVLLALPSLDATHHILPDGLLAHGTAVPSGVRRGVDWLVSGWLTKAHRYPFLHGPLAARIDQQLAESPWSRAG